MAEGRTIQEVAEDVLARAASKEDYISDTRDLVATTDEGGTTRLRMKGVTDQEGFISVIGEDGLQRSDFEVGRHAHYQISARLGIPKKYYDRMRSDQPVLLDENINGWFEQEPERRLIRTLHGKARAFLSDRYRRIDNEDIMERVLPILAEFPDLVFHSSEVTDSKLYIKAVLPQITAEIKTTPIDRGDYYKNPGGGATTQSWGGSSDLQIDPNARLGDVIQSGIFISNSEIGDGAVTVAPFTFTLACRNGMVVERIGTRRHHVGRALGNDLEEAHKLYRDETLKADDEALMMKIGDLVRAVATQETFEQIVAQLQTAADQPIEGDPVQAVERVTKKFDLTEGESGSVLRHLTTGGNLSAYGMLNAITRAAQDDDSYDRHTELERVGGQVLDLEPSFWAAS